MKFSIAGLDVSSLCAPKNIDEFRSSFSMNSGNLLFHYAAEKIVKLSPKKYNWSLKGASKDNKCGGVIIPMANHLGTHVDLSNKGPNLNDVDVPVVVLGLGSQFSSSKVSHFNEIPEGSVRWLKKAADLSCGGKNIAVRGVFTYKLLKKLGLEDSVEVTGCQSNFINPSDSLGEELFNKFNSLTRSQLRDGICVTAGNYNRRDLAKLEQSLIELIKGRSSSYVVQNPKHLISLSSGWGDGVPEKVLQDIQTAWLPDVDLDLLPSWFQYHSSVFISVPQWLFEMSKKSFVVGTRIHGVQAAIQAGTPALCLCIDSRTKELCEFMKVPHVDAANYHDGISFDDILSEFRSWDYIQFDENRKRLARKMKRFLVSNGVAPSEHMLAVCK
ncbi:polysaccharide pyruvyl transferase family protein [Halomonas organivorans]|uniref:Polysaccharide pyruvyl transferase domain-containing protein n=1 Tax=Halomonas organivorans TaxID=257772 RepID=A0A7W5C0X7_9GAMM|nr:polysaccharide pyruvyl transferase family protein [Halomonas organivorans]MBB3142627.1 hypothetical protein [Halomonas organivorans]